jgi:ribosomal-protein-alanine N-acetyltransferase
LDPEARTETGQGLIRPLRPTDLADCLDLDRRALGGLWSETQWQRELAEQNRPGLGIWRAEGLRAMACGWLILDELHITVVAVDPAFRRRGLGRGVLAGLLAHGQAAGARHATLEVAAANGAARGLYADAGFKEAGIRRAYYRNGDDALIQWLKLVPWPPVRETGDLC